MFAMMQTLSVRASAAAQMVPAQHHHLLRAVELADSSAGLTAPHPNAGCVIAHGPRVVGEGFLYAQGTKSAEVQAVERARDDARGGIAYLNLEPGDCHGDDSAVMALKQARVSRVVVGLRHPLLHLRGKAINALRNDGIAVDVLGEDLNEGDRFQEALQCCRMVNAPLLCRATQRMPYSVLKYAMTLDGKIAASTGHASWVSSKESRQRVFATRGRSDAVIVGGNTVRRDNPRLTTRQEGGHLPVRIVMSRTLHLPEELHLWDVANAPTTVMTQRGARSDFQARLAARGVEIVEFDFLTPKGVMDYCYDRGFLSVLWECGGTLAAPAIASGVIHKVLAFVAPKIIGGVLAPSPVGDLGMVEMTQALMLSDVDFEKTGTDMLITGYLQQIPGLWPPTIAAVEAALAVDDSILSVHSRPAVISFYKAWEPYGALSNFSPHPISLPDSNGNDKMWGSVEHYYQAQKFVGVEDALAEEITKKIQRAPSPEEAARFGRSLMRERPDLVRKDWDSAKVDSMYKALRAKFSSYPSLQKMLVSTAGSVLVEASTHDLFWGAGRAGTGKNNLGLLLMKLRSECSSEVLGWLSLELLYSFSSGRTLPSRRSKLFTRLLTSPNRDTPFEPWSWVVMDKLNGTPLPIQTSCSGGTAWHKTWQTDSDSALRQTVAENILQDIFSELQGPVSPELQQVLRDLVTHLEEELYRSAGTKEEYADKHTIDSRLQALAKRTITGNQSAPQHGSQTMSSSPGSANTIVPTGGTVSNVNSTSVLFADLSN